MSDERKPRATCVWRDRGCTGGLLRTFARDARPEACRSAAADNWIVNGRKLRGGALQAFLGFSASVRQCFAELDKRETTNNNCISFKDDVTAA